MKYCLAATQYTGFGKYLLKAFCHRGQARRYFFYTPLF